MLEQWNAESMEKIMVSEEAQALIARMGG